jgi:hypothetical protein
MITGSLWAGKRGSRFLFRPIGQGIFLRFSWPRPSPWPDRERGRRFSPTGAGARLRLDCGESPVGTCFLRVGKRGSRFLIRPGGKGSYQPVRRPRASPWPDRTRPAKPPSGGKSTPILPRLGHFGGQVPAPRRIKIIPGHHAPQSPTIRRIFSPNAPQKPAANRPPPAAMPPIS